MGQIYRIISQLTRDNTSLQAEITQTHNAIRAAHAILDEPFARESEWREKTARLHELTQPAQVVKTSEKVHETDPPRATSATDRTTRVEAVHEASPHRDTQRAVSGASDNGQRIQPGQRVTYQEHEWWVVGTGKRNGQPILELERETDNIIVPRVGASIYVDDEPVQVLDTPAVKPQWVCAAIAENSIQTQTRTPVEHREPQRHRVHCR